MPALSCTVFLSLTKSIKQLVLKIIFRKTAALTGQSIEKIEFRTEKAVERCAPALQGFFMSGFRKSERGEKQLDAFWEIQGS